MSAPEKIGAFFDLDGTLLRPPSLEWRFIIHLLARDEIGTGHVARWLGSFAESVLCDPHSAALGNKRYLAGIRESVVEDWACAFASKALPLFEGGVGRMKWHLERRHPIVLVTGTLAPLARVVARHLPASAEICSTEIELRDRHFTGRLAGAHMSYDMKARAVREIAAANGLDLSRSYAYGNQMSDFRMLEAVGNPAAVNPSWRLARVARRRGWSISEWSELRLAAAMVGRPSLAPRVAR
jgi:HAD superfamily hydrolase (TIGR01490 family)